MILELQEFAKKHKSKRILFVYEASGLGIGREGPHGGSPIAKTPSKKAA